MFWKYYVDRNENYTPKSIYNQIDFVVNGQEGEKLCSSEFLYWSIFVSTGMNKFALTISAALMNFSAALAAIMTTKIKTTRLN